MIAAETRRWRIAKRLKEARAKRKPRISQAEIARRVVESGQKHITEGHISRFELGYLEATTAEAKAIAQVLDVSTDWLCGSEQLANVAPVAPAAGLARAAGVQAPKANSSSAEESKWPRCPGPDAVKRGEESPEAYRSRLLDLRAQTNRMLHTSGLPAAEWRQWRELERLIVEGLRT